MGQAIAIEPQVVAEAIDQYVRPDTFAVGIKVFKDEPLPPRMRRPQADLGIKIGICQGISFARRYGWVIGMANEDLQCPIAQLAFGFEEAIPYYTEGNLAAGMYVETCGEGALTEAELPKFTAAEAGTVVVAPLQRCSFTPDMLLVYGNSAQVMRLVAASLYKRGGAMASASTARGDCADIVVRTIQTGEPQYVLPCYGDRIFGQTQDTEMAFTCPWDRIPELMAGFEGTHKGGVRYPIPNYLSYEAHFPKTYQKLQQLWQQEKEDTGGAS